MAQACGGVVVVIPDMGAQEWVISKFEVCDSTYATRR